MFIFKILGFVFIFLHKFSGLFFYIFYKLDDYKIAIKDFISEVLLDYWMTKSVLFQAIKNISIFPFFIIKAIPGQITIYLYKFCISFLILMTLTYFFVSIWFTWYICEKEIMFSYLYQRDISYDFWTWYVFDGDYKAEFEFYKIILGYMFNIYIYMFNIILLLLLFHIIYSLKNIIRDYINGINMKLYNIYCNLIIFILLYNVFNIYKLVTSYLTLTLFFNIYIINIYLIIILISVYTIKAIINILITKEYSKINFFYPFLFTDEQRNVLYFYIFLIFIVYITISTYSWLWDWSIQFVSSYKHPTWTPFGDIGGSIYRTLTLNWLFYVLWDAPVKLLIWFIKGFVTYIVFWGVSFNLKLFVYTPFYYLLYTFVYNLFLFI